MRGISFAIVAIGLMLGAAHSQPPPKDAPAPEKAASASLEELLAKALVNSPEVQVAQAKLREAEAELRRSRMNLLQQIIDLQSKLEMQKNQVVYAEIALSKSNKLRQSNMISEEDLTLARKHLVDAKSVLARIEAQFGALTDSPTDRFGKLIEHNDGRHRISVGEGLRIGVGGGDGIGAGGGDPDEPVRRAPSPAMADKLRKALDTPVKSGDFNDQPLSEVLKHFRELSGQVPFVVAPHGGNEPMITMNLGKELPLGAVFQAIQDLAPGLVITVRDYGFLFTFNVGPDDGLPYLDFWQGKQKK